MIPVSAHIPTGYAEEVYASLCSNSYLFAAPPVIHWAECGDKIPTSCIAKVGKNDGHANYLNHVTAVLQLDLLDGLSVIKSDDMSREDTSSFSEAGDEEEIPYFSSSEEETGFGLYIDRLQSIPTTNDPFTRVWIAARLPGGYQPIGVDIIGPTASSPFPIGQSTDVVTLGSPMVLSLLSAELVPGEDNSNSPTLHTADLFRITSEQLANAYLSWQPRTLRVESVDEMNNIQDDATSLCASVSRATTASTEATPPHGHATAHHDINVVDPANASHHVRASHDATASHEADDALVFPSLAAALGAVCPHTLRLRHERMSRLLGAYNCGAGVTEEAESASSGDPC